MSRFRRKTERAGSDRTRQRPATDICLSDDMYTSIALGLAGLIEPGAALSIVRRLGAEHSGGAADPVRATAPIPGRYPPRGQAREPGWGADGGTQKRER